MKKILAIILAFTMLFSFTAMPASAELGDSDQSININEAKSIFERIADVFHDLVANLFKALGMDCPLCENHDGYGEAEGDGEFNKAELSKQYNDAVNELKAYKKTLTIDQARTIKKVELTGVPYSLKETINDFLDEFMGRSEESNSFKAGESVKISAVIPPEGREAQLSGAYVDVISYYKSNDDTKIEFTLKDSVSIFDGTSTTNPVGYIEAFEPINLGVYDFEKFEIIYAEITYSDVKAEATMNYNGKLKELRTSSTITINATLETNTGKTPVTLVLDCADEYQIKY